MRQLFRWMSRPKSTVTKLPVLVPVMEELTRAWEAVTLADIESSNQRLQELKKGGGTVLGVVYGPDARRTWAAADYLALRRDEEMLHARSRATDASEGRVHAEIASRYDLLEDVLRAMFWVQAKDDIGSVAWQHPRCSLRQGWKLVSTRPPSMADMFGMVAVPREEE